MRAVKSLATMRRSEQQRIRTAIELLAEDPRSPACVAMRGFGLSRPSR